MAAAADGQSVTGRCASSPGVPRWLMLRELAPPELTCVFSFAVHQVTPPTFRGAQTGPDKVRVAEDVCPELVADTLAALNKELNTGVGRVW